MVLLSLAFSDPPFRIEEEGWGEFDMAIAFQAPDYKEQVISHDLNFQTNRYEAKHTLVSGLLPFCDAPWGRSLLTTTTADL